MPFGIHLAALQRFRRDALVVAVELIVALQPVGREIPVERALAAGGALEQLVGEALGIEVVVAADAGAAAEGQFLALVALGDDIDDAAGSARTVEAAGAGDDLDALDARRRDAVELARHVAAGVLRDAVDQHLHVAPADGLAEVAHGPGRRRQARHQGAEDIGDLASGGFLLGDLLRLDHLHGAGDRGDAGVAAAGRDHRVAQR
ncbi:hypothetical protein D3C78_520440 [compost metagenome]